MSTGTLSALRLARLRGRRRGFTLVELMVAITGGMFVSLAVFAISRQTGRFYTRETRVTDATLASMVGFERLRADLGRAGFLSSPNIAIDPHLCGTPATYPAMLRRLAPLRILPGTSPAALSQHMIDNGRTPDELIVMGSYTGAEVFPIWNVEVNGNEFVVHLQSLTGPLGRMGYAASANKQAMLEAIFGATRGRGLRIQDQSGEVQYGTINRVETAVSPRVVLEQAPGLLFRQTAGNVCGLKGNVTGAVVNVVNFVRYDLRNIQANASYTAAYTAGGHPYDSTTRFDLVRAELDTAGTLIANSEELISEYAVDFKLGITHADNAVPSLTDQTLQEYPATNTAAILARAGDLVGDVAVQSNGPQRVRAVRVRLAVRSQEPDRDTSPAPPIAGQFFRVGLGPSAGAPFARVRTIQADVALNNQTAVFF